MNEKEGEKGNERKGIRKREWDKGSKREKVNEWKRLTKREKGNERKGVRERKGMREKFM